MIVRFCPFCSSSKVRMFQKSITPEEERDTEVWLCESCKLTFLRERHYVEESWNDLIKKYGLIAVPEGCIID